MRASSSSCSSGSPIRPRPASTSTTRQGTWRRRRRSASMRSISPRHPPWAPRWRSAACSRLWSGSRVRRALRWLLGGALTLALLVSIGLASGYLWLRQSLPTIDGALEVAGLGAPVRIVRDAYAVPHIEAASFGDAIFAQGFVHAQDRLWQMDFRRRLGSGRLAEVLGPAALPTDRFMRTLGFAAAAEASIAHLRPDTVALLEAYAAGINAYLATRTGPLPLEFLILDYEPEPWTPVDSLVWMRVLALDLSGNWRDELLRARLASRLSSDQIADLWPEGTAPITLVELA